MSCSSHISFKKYVGLQNLIQRNEQLYGSGNTPSGGVALPFILVQVKLIISLWVFIVTSNETYAIFVFLNVLPYCPCLEKVYNYTFTGLMQFIFLES